MQSIWSVKTIISIITFLGIIFAGFSDKAAKLRQQLTCQIDSEEWCATIPRNISELALKSNDICIFKFEAKVYDSKIDLDVTIRSQDSRLNQKGIGPLTSISLKLHSISKGVANDVINFGPQDQSVMISISRFFNTRTSAQPYAYIKTHRTPRGSYGQAFHCQ